MPGQRFLHRSALALCFVSIAASSASPPRARAGEAAHAHDMSAADLDLYRSEESKWRQERENRLKADSGWLTVAGLYWLDEGRTPFGTGESNPIRLPEGSAPADCGSFTRTDSTVALKVAPGVSILLNGEPVLDRVLHTDHSADGPDILKLGRLSMHVIVRGDRYGIRLKDLESPMRKEFTHLDWYDVNPEYRIEGKWVAYDPPKKLAIPNVLGQVDEMLCPGYVEFAVDHQELARLEPVTDSLESNELSFIFADATTGVTTYPGGRFLDTEGPKDGKLLIDFNRAYNPPCAFTPYATCPLPADVNKIKVRIEAGEKNYGEHR